MAANPQLTGSRARRGTRTLGRVTPIFVQGLFALLPVGGDDRHRVVTAGPRRRGVRRPYSYQVGGFTMIVPRESVQPLDMRLEEAMRFIVTAGAKADESKSPSGVSPPA